MANRGLSLRVGVLAKARAVRPRATPRTQKGHTNTTDSPRSTAQPHALSHTIIRSFTHSYIHTFIPTYLHTYIPTYLHTYIHTYIKRGCVQWHTKHGTRVDLRMCVCRSRVCQRCEARLDKSLPHAPRRSTSRRHINVTWQLFLLVVSVRGFTSASRRSLSMSSPMVTLLVLQSLPATDVSARTRGSVQSAISSGDCRMEFERGTIRSTCALALRSQSHERDDALWHERISVLWRPHHVFALGLWSVGCLVWYDTR